MSGRAVVGKSDPRGVPGFSSKVVVSTNGRSPDQVKSVGSGVTFVGSPNWRHVVQLGDVVNPDAERLTRSIALATSAYAYTAILYRASAMAEPRLYLAQETEEGEGEVFDHEILSLLEDPSPDYDMGELQQLTEMYRLITGACLWVKQTDLAGRVQRWVPYSGDEFTTEAFGDRIYGKFRIQTKNGPKTYLPEEVVHFRELNPGSWRTNLSKLDVALAQLDLGHQINRTVHNFMQKAMFPGGIISPDAEWNPDDDTWDEWRNAIEAWHQGPANAGSPLVVQGGTTLSSVNTGIKDMLPTDILDRVEATIGSVFGIPPVVLGWKVGLENSPWSQMSEARAMTYEDTIEPRWRDVEKKMRRQLLTEEERNAKKLIIRFDTSNVRALMEDDELRSRVAMTMRREWTRNERRIYTGRDPLDEDDPRGDEIEGGSGGASLIGDDLMGELGNVSTSLSRLASAGKSLDTKTLEWVMFDVATKAAESTWERQVATFLDDAKRELTGILDDQVREKQLDPDSLINFVALAGDYIRETMKNGLERLTYPLIISTGTTGVKRAAAQTGLSFAVLQEGLLDFAQEEARFLGSVMGKTTGDAVAKIVQDSLASGETVSGIRKALQESAAFSRTRAQRVARTETTRAWNGAQRRSLSMWKDSQSEGVDVTKMWLSSRDDRVRPEHDALDGETVKVNETFSNGLDQPGEPNCRCTQIFSVERS